MLKNINLTICMNERSPQWNYFSFYKMNVQLFNRYYIRTCLKSQEQKFEHRDASIPLHGTVSCKLTPLMRWDRPTKVETSKEIA